jgi:hypothetical protein
MSKSSRRGRSSGSGSRLQTIGVFATLLVVAVLVGSLAAGLFQRSAAGPAAADSGRWVSSVRPGERVRVQVLNASGRAGLARDATRELRDHGFDVLEFGNAPSGSDPERSVVLDRVGKLETARQVADALRIQRVEARPDSNLVLDVTVVLGRDWAGDTASTRQTPPVEQTSP